MSDCLLSSSFMYGVSGIISCQLVPEEVDDQSAREKEEKERQPKQEADEIVHWPGLRAAEERSDLHTAYVNQAFPTQRFTHPAWGWPWVVWIPGCSHIDL